MNGFPTAVLTALGSFFTAMLIAPLVVKLAKGRAEQTVLGYVTQHEGKAGTPTFGGLIFIISSVAAASVAGVFSYELGRMLMLVFVGYGLIGFTDDFIKIKLKRNKGLAAWQKIIFQLGAGCLAVRAGDGDDFSGKFSGAEFDF